MAHLQPVSPYCLRTPDLVMRLLLQALALGSQHSVAQSQNKTGAKSHLFEFLPCAHCEPYQTHFFAYTSVRALHSVNLNWLLTMVRAAHVGKEAILTFNPMEEIQTFFSTCHALVDPTGPVFTHTHTFSKCRHPTALTQDEEQILRK